MPRFAGKVVVVTGGGGGIGGATCRRFAREGAKVAVFDLNLEAAEQGRGSDRAGRAAVAAGVRLRHHRPRRASTRRSTHAEDEARPDRRARQQRRLGRFPPLHQDRARAVGQADRRSISSGALHMHHAVLPGMAARKRAASSTSRRTRRASAPRARRSTRPARAAWCLLQDHRARACAARRHRQRGLSRADRHRALRRIQGGRRQSREADGGFHPLDPARPHRPAGRPAWRDPVLRQRRGGFVTGQVLSVSGGLTMAG